MYDVPCGPERVAFDTSQLVHVQPPLEWATNWPDRAQGLPVSMDGTDDGPYGVLVELAELVLPKIDALAAASNKYLHSWIDVRAQFFEGDWKLRSLRLPWEGLTGPLRGIVFELTLSIREDDYGEWSVRWKHHTFPRNVFVPYAFSRRQW
ncbi:MAG: hypothetical protein QM820_40905 [Minicystis sp.]